MSWKVWVSIFFFYCIECLYVLYQLNPAQQINASLSFPKLLRLSPYTGVGWMLTIFKRGFRFLKWYFKGMTQKLQYLCKYVYFQVQRFCDLPDLHGWWGWGRCQAPTVRPYQGDNSQGRVEPVKTTLCLKLIQFKDRMYLADFSRNWTG